MAKSAPEKWVRLLQPPDEHGIAVVELLTRRESALYVVREIPCEIGGRGFEVHKLGLGLLYHVRVGEPQDCSCECYGFLNHARCKHILGLKALIDRGKL